MQDADKLETKLKAFLLKARNDANYQLSNFDANKQNIHYTLMDENLTIVLSYQGIRSLNTVIDLLYENYNIKSNFSKKRVKKIVESYLVKLVYSPSKGIDKVTASKVQEMISYFENVRFSNWESIIPIKNLKLDLPDLTIGGVKFEYCNDSYFTGFREHFKVVPPPTEEVRQKLLEIPTHFNNQVIAKCSVFVTDKEQAFERSHIDISLALNVLKFYSLGIMKNNPRFYRMHIEKEGHNFSGHTPIFCSYRDQSDESNSIYDFTIQRTGFLYPFHISKGEFELMNRLHLSDMNQILTKKIELRTELEDRLIKAISLFGDSIYESNTSIAFVGIIISLEVLLLNPRESKGALAERIALLLKQDYQERSEIAQDIERLYNLRSNFVHSGDNQISELDVTQIAYITFFVIIEMFNWITKCPNWGDMIDIFERNKFSGPKLRSF